MQQDYPKIVSNRLRFCYNRMYCSDSGLHKQGGFSNFAIPKFNSSLMTNADTDIQELSNFLLDFATTLMGVGSHTSRVVRNVNRIAESFGYGVDMLIFIVCSFVASLVAALGVYSDWGTTQDVALGTSVLFLIPGVPLINSILDILEGHVLIGFSRAINAAILIICIALGLSMTLLILGKEVL